VLLNQDRPSCTKQTPMALPVARLTQVDHDARSSQINDMLDFKTHGFCMLDFKTHGF